MNEKSGVQILQLYFGESKKLDMAELKALSLEARVELADLAATAMGYTKKDKDGKIVYVKE